MYRSFDSCIVRSLRVSCVHFVYRAFVSYILRFSCRSCEAFVRFPFVLFAFFVRLHFVHSVNLYDPGSVSMQSVSITTDVVTSNLDQGEVYNIM